MPKFSWTTRLLYPNMERIELKDNNLKQVWLTEAVVFISDLAQSVQTFTESNVNMKGKELETQKSMTYDDLKLTNKLQGHYFLKICEPKKVKWR